MKELDGDELDKLMPREATFSFSSSVISIFATMQAPMRRSASGLLRAVESSPQAGPSSRCISTTAVVLGKPRRQRQVNDPLAIKNMGEFGFDDIPTHGHLYLQRQRELLNYTRVLHWELPKLACECQTWSVMLAKKALLTCLLYSLSEGICTTGKGEYTSI
jgi:hypothetical protein